MATDFDQAERFAIVRAAASRVFESDGLADRWLMEPNRALGDMTPLQLLNSELGLEQVLRELGAIEHGLPL